MEFALTEGDLVEWLAEPELRGTRDMDLGDVLEIQNLAASCRGWIGDAPISMDAEQTAKKLKASPDDWTRAARPEYADRFILTTFGVQSTGGLVGPAAVGIEQVFRDDERELNEGQRILIHTVFPSAQYQITRTSNTEFNSESSAGLEASAELAPPGHLKPLSSALAAAGIAGDLKASGNQRIALTAKHRLAWSTTTHASMVEAIGEGDTRALWVFHRPQGPLTGKGFETVTGLTLGRTRSGISFDARMFVIFKIGPYPIRRYSPWIRLSTEWG